MDIEKLIHCLQCCARVDTHNVGCDDCELEYCGPECQQLCWTAATALSTLQAENEKLRSEAEGMRSNWYKSVEKIQKLRAELEKAKAERDAAVECLRNKCPFCRKYLTCQGRTINNDCWEFFGLKED